MGSKTHCKGLLSSPKPIEIHGTLMEGAEAHYSAIRGLFGAVELMYLLLQSWPLWEETPWAG